MIVRSESAADVAGVRDVNQAAFGTSVEAHLVDRLRANARPVISLVAQDAGAIVGHIMFSPGTVDNLPGVSVMGLAPMAVLPSHQHRGIGSQLVTAGLDACKALGVRAVVVLGHPTYYPRFGFTPASVFGARCEYDVPDDVFMALELTPGALGKDAGLVRYHAEFSGL